jgi:hypothetical protein
MKNLTFYLLLLLVFTACNKDENPIIEPSAVHPLVGNWNLEHHYLNMANDSLINEGSLNYTVEIKDNGVFLLNRIVDITTNYWLLNEDKTAIFIIEEFPNANGNLFTSSKKMNIEINEQDYQVWKSTHSYMNSDSLNMVHTETWTLERQ